MALAAAKSALAAAKKRLRQQTQVVYMFWILSLEVGVYNCYPFGSPLTYDMTKTRENEQSAKNMQIVKNKISKAGMITRQM